MILLLIISAIVVLSSAYLIYLQMVKEGERDWLMRSIKKMHIDNSV
jgi:hypothetical protein